MVNRDRTIAQNKFSSKPKLRSLFKPNFYLGHSGMNYFFSSSWVNLGFWETDSKIETILQDIYWGLLSEKGKTGQREQLNCNSAPINVFGSQILLELGYLFRDVLIWKKGEKILYSQYSHSKDRYSLKWKSSFQQEVVSNLGRAQEPNHLAAEGKSA